MVLGKNVYLNHVISDQFLHLNFYETYYIVRKKKKLSDKKTYTCIVQSSRTHVIFSHVCKQH